MVNKQITKEILNDLYWKKGNSLSQIAKRFGMRSQNAVTYHMDKFGIKRRPSSRKNYIRFEFSGNLNEKAYLIGLRTGDIHARKHCRLIAVSMTSPKSTQMKMFRTSFAKYSHINEYECNGGFTQKSRQVRCYLHPSFKFLIEKSKTIPNWIMKNNELFYYFLAGYCDSEASWIITEHKKYDGRWKDLIFSLGTSDKKILQQIHQKLKEFGFNSHLYMVKKKGTENTINGIIIRNFDLYRVMMMSHKDVVKLAKILLPLSKHEDKQKAKLRIINYNEVNLKRKELKRKNLGTVKMLCIKCGHKKVWKNGYSKYKDKKYTRYKCPLCKHEFQKGYVITCPQ